MRPPSSLTQALRPTLLLVALLARDPALITPSASAQSVGLTLSETRPDSQRWKWSFNRSFIEITSSTEVFYNEDYSDVARLGRKASFKLIDNRSGKTYQFELSSSDGAAITRTLLINKKKSAWDAHAQNTFSKTLQFAVQELGLEASNRAKSILKHKGSEGLLAEIEALPKEHVSQLYLAELFRSNQATPEVVAKALSIVSRKFSFDYNKAQAICNLTATHLQNPEVKTLAYQILGSFSSNYEQTRSSLHLLKLGTARPSILEAAKRMNSDYEKTRILIEVAPSVPADPTIVSPFFQLLDSVHSDFERSRTLQSVLASKTPLSAELLSQTLTAAQKLKSGFERTQFLKRFLNARPESPAHDPLPEGFFTMLDSIDSSHDRRQVITEIVQRRRSDKPSLIRCLKAISRFQNEFDKASALIELVPQAAQDEELKDHLIQAAKTLRSDFERGRVRAALIKS